MLYDTYCAFRDRVEYVKKDGGAWKAEFHGPIDLVAEGPTLELCRRAILDALDAALAAWISQRDTDPKRVGLQN
jgi:hypothetical protein